jgi:hypothetical protein
MFPPLLLTGVFPMESPDEHQTRILAETAEARAKLLPLEREKMLSFIKDPESIPDLGEKTVNLIHCIHLLGKLTKPEDRDEVMIGLLLIKLRLVN